MVENKGAEGAQDQEPHQSERLLLASRVAFSRAQCKPVVVARSLTAHIQQVFLKSLSCRKSCREH